MSFNKLVYRFDFTEAELARLLYSVNGFIAGSSALNVFMKDDLYKDIDLDIFLRIPYSRKEIENKFKSNYYPYEELAKDKIRNLLNLKKYEEISTPNIDYTLISNISHIIKNILTFEKNNKKIQVIIIYDCTINELLDSFDLSICRIAITSDDDKLNLYTEHLTNNEKTEIMERKMYITNINNIEKIKIRINKYINRRFELINSDTKKTIPIKTQKDLINLHQILQQRLNYKNTKTDNIEEPFEKEDIEEPFEKEDIEVPFEKEDIEVPFEKEDIEEPFEKEDIEVFTIDDIQKGVEYMNDNKLIINCINYSFTLEDIKYKKINCLDEFKLIKDIDMNISIKFNLDKLIKIGSCGGVSVYLYKLINHIKAMTITEIVIKEPNYNKSLENAFIKNKNIIKTTYYFDDTNLSLDKVQQKMDKLFIMCIMSLDI